METTADSWQDAVVNAIENNVSDNQYFCFGVKILGAPLRCGFVNGFRVNQYNYACEFQIAVADTNICVNRFVLSKIEGVQFGWLQK